MVDGTRKLIGIVSEHDLLAAVDDGHALGEAFQIADDLLDVEGDAVRDVLRVAQVRAAPLQRVDEPHGLTVERRVFLRRRGAEVRLQRDVAQILQRQDAEITGMSEDNVKTRLHRARGKLRTELKGA